MPHPPNLQLGAARVPHSLGWLELAMVPAGAIDAGRFLWFELSWSLRHTGLILWLRWMRCWLRVATRLLGYR
jgi:hypothetical protein